MAQEIVLNDAQLESADLLTYDLLITKAVHIDYTIRREALTEMGEIVVTYNPSTLASQTCVVANFDDCGVRFCSVVEDGMLKILYTSTDTGCSPVFKYLVTDYGL